MRGFVLRRFALRLKQSTEKTKVMVLVFLKRLLAPQWQDAQYKQVPNGPLDCERGSLDSSTSAGDDFNEKRPKSSEKTATASRINPRIISDATIGLSDGLTVPFALTAGLSALGNNNFVIYGGLAELIAGGISMGLGGYLGSKSEAEAYAAALTETKSIVDTDRDRAVDMIRSAFSRYDFPEQTVDSMAASLLVDPRLMVEFLMRFHHRLAEGDYTTSRAYVCGLTISLGYIFGGLIPLLPYVFIADTQRAFLSSVIVMALALFAFGWIKTSLVGERHTWNCFMNGVQMVMLGGTAAGAAIACVKAVGS